VLEALEHEVERSEVVPVKTLDSVAILFSKLEQPEREWQGLTDEEISELIRNTHNTGSFVRAIEAKLKEKNT